MWHEVVKKIRGNSQEGREISYMDGAIGITSLLQCPLKWELSQRYGIKAESVEIDDGFVWEKQVKSAFKELFSGVEEEKDLIYEVDGYKIHGHLDLFVEKGDEVIGVELKSPKFLLLRGIPKDIDGLVVDDGTMVIHNPQYYMQAKIERFLLERLYPEKRVRVFLFYKALCKHRTFSKKLYVVSEVKESINEEELKELLRKFHEDKSPRYPNECESYCVFYKEGLCEGKPYTESKNDNNVLELLKEYRALQSDLKLLETYLKKVIKTPLRFGDKEIGWIKREVKELDIKKILALPIENPEEYLTVKWQKKDELIKTFGEELIKEVKEEWVWRL